MCFFKLRIFFSFLRQPSLSNFMYVLMKQKKKEDIFHAKNPTAWKKLDPNINYTSNWWSLFRLATMFSFSKIKLMRALHVLFSFNTLLVMCFYHVCYLSLALLIIRDLYHVLLIMRAPHYEQSLLCKYLIMRAYLHARFSFLRFRFYVIKSAMWIMAVLVKIW